MNARTTLFARLILGVGLTLTGCISHGNGSGEGFPQSKQVDPVSYHVAALEEHEGKLAMLSPELQKLETLIDRYTQTPYLDPKGFRRSGWNTLKGRWEKEVNTLRQRITWHTHELAKIQTSATRHGVLMEERS